MVQALHPSALDQSTLENVVSQVQAILWLDVNADQDVWNPDKDWSPGSDFLDMIAHVLTEAGLRPTGLHPTEKHDCWAPENVVHSLFESSRGGMQDAYHCRICGDLLQVG